VLARDEADATQRRLLQWWGKSKVDTDEATARWAQHLTSSSLSILKSLRRRVDRVDYARYLLTGRAFLPGQGAATGNPTFFCLPPEYSGYKKGDENLFHSIDVNSLNWKESLKTAMEQRFKLLVTVLRRNLTEGKLSISIEVKELAPERTDVFDEIQQLNPAQIDWSNVPEYLGAPEKFFLMARMCSGDATRHTFHLMNWHSKVFGCNLVDYVSQEENYRKEGFSLDDKYSDRAGVLTKLLKHLTSELKETISKAPLPSFIHLDLETFNPMDLSESVFSRRFVDNFMRFMFEKQPESMVWTW
jgi:hypothetical protein